MLNERSKGSIEFKASKHQCSTTSWLSILQGYKPRANFQRDGFG